MEVPHALVLLLWLTTLLLNCSQGSPACSDDDGCGWNSFCESGRCKCIPGHTLSENKRDCTDVRCYDSHCLECLDPDKCRRCIGFIEAGTGRCLDGCRNSYMLVIEGTQVGRVCPVSVRDNGLKVYVAIVVGVGAGIFLTGVVVLCFCWLSKEKKYKSQKPRPPSRLEIEKVQDTGRVNKAFENIYIQNGGPANGNTPKRASTNGLTSKVNERPRQPSAPVNAHAFIDLVKRLRPYLDTFISMLREVKVRNTALPKGDTRSYVYKNVIHQLIRIMGYLNSEEESKQVPPDGVLLLKWGENLLQKYLTIKDPNSWEPGSQLGTFTSSFKPDHKFVPREISPGTNHSNSTFKYERYGEGELQNMPDDYKSLTLELNNGYTEPIEV